MSLDQTIIHDGNMMKLGNVAGTWANTFQRLPLHNFGGIAQMLYW